MDADFICSTAADQIRNKRTAPFQLDSPRNLYKKEKEIKEEELTSSGWPRRRPGDVALQVDSCTSRIASSSYYIQQCSRHLWYVAGEVPLRAFAHCCNTSTASIRRGFHACTSAPISTRYLARCIFIHFSTFNRRRFSFHSPFDR